MVRNLGDLVAKEFWARRQRHIQAMGRRGLRPTDDVWQQVGGIRGGWHPLNAHIYRVPAVSGCLSSPPVWNLRTSLSFIWGLVHLILAIFLWVGTVTLPTVHMETQSQEGGRIHPGWYTTSKTQLQGSDFSLCRVPSLSLCPKRGDARMLQTPRSHCSFVMREKR